MQQWHLKQQLLPYSHRKQWPALPVVNTTALTIAISTQAPSALQQEQGSFLLYASPKEPTRWPDAFMLKLDQDGNIRHCVPKRDDEVEQCKVL